MREREREQKSTLIGVFGCVSEKRERERESYISLIKPNGVDVRCEYVQICAFASFKACRLVQQKAKHLLRF